MQIECQAADGNAGEELENEYGRAAKLPAHTHFPNIEHAGGTRFVNAVHNVRVLYF
jgi:hypothetical protein